jgi:chromosome segregation ATPase
MIPSLNMSLGELVQWTMALVALGGGGAIFFRRVGKTTAQDKLETNVLDRSNEQVDIFAKQAEDMARVVGDLRTEMVKLGLQVDRMTVENQRLHSQIDVLSEENQRLHSQINVLTEENVQLANRVSQLEAQLEARK